MPVFEELNFWLIVFGLFSYVVGSFNTAIFITKFFCHKDITKEGSGNPGTTNVIRVCGLKWGMITLFVDVLKGALATSIAAVFYGYASQIGLVAMLTCGLAAIIGTMWPWCYKVGGKGIATLGGIAIFINPLLGLSLLAAILISFFLVRIMSIFSLLGTLTWAGVSIWLTIENGNEFLPIIIGLYCVYVILIFFKFRGNIVRIFTGKEKRIELKRDRITNK
ncbi:MAG: glycerol-3-phosphate acyltransferase [Christensenellaceae bacterium]|jgi:glycerol-3-phosphate acyltransferase PlsY|nr:glycerol-3-phosphate acyltransferase [Christensenellaceae bacterium]